MKKKLAHSIAIFSLLALIMAFVSLPAYGQTLNWRADKSAYIPGDSGTVTITIINTGGSPLEIRNITVFYPWAGFDTNGKWLSGGNVSINVSPVKVLTSVSGGGNNVSYTTQSFTVPSWWGATSQVQFSCPGNTSTRYGQYSGCILLGTSGNGLRYGGTDIAITMAAPIYFPSSISILSEWVPLATLVVLIVATAFLALTWMSLRTVPKKP